MSGILERIEAKLDQLLAGNAAGTAASHQAVQQTTQASQQASTLLGAATQQYQQPTPSIPDNVTSDAILQLILPHVENPAIKDALGVAMRSRGINDLNMIPEAQYREIYALFQGILLQHGVGGAPAVQQAAAASII